VVPGGIAAEDQSPQGACPRGQGSIVHSLDQALKYISRLINISCRFIKLTMKRPITLVTGQWADVPLSELAAKASSWGYDGLELATWGDHLDVFRASEDLDYCESQKEILKKNHLEVWAISCAIAGQLTLDPNNDTRSDAFAPANCSGDPEKKRDWAIRSVKASARAAHNMGVSVVTTLIGSSIWHLLYSFPPVSEKTIAAGFNQFAEVWNPILDIFDELNVRIALECHPTGIAYDIVTAERVLDMVDQRKVLGFNFDPSHLFWQYVDPALFIRTFSDRIYHAHMKDCCLQLNGRSSILSSHLNFGHPERGWDFRSPGHGEVDFEEIIRALNEIEYTGPLSVEWEDAGMDREYGAADARKFIEHLNFTPSERSFDAAFGK